MLQLAHWLGGGRYLLGFLVLEQFIFGIVFLEGTFELLGIFLSHSRDVVDEVWERVRQIVLRPYLTVHQYVHDGLLLN